MAEVTNSPTLSFVVPALNEEGNIEATVTAILEAMLEAGGLFEVILVNDGSTDRTGELMDALATRYSQIRVVHNRRNSGYGGAFKAGAAEARLDYVIRICGDNCSPAASIRQIVAEIGKADIVIPYIANPERRPWGRRAASRAFTELINVLFGLRVPYYNHSVVFPRRALAGITIETDGFAYQAEALVKLLRGGYTFCVVGVEDVPRVAGVSTALRPRNLKAVLQTIARLVREVHGRGSAAARLGDSVRTCSGPEPASREETKRR